MKNEALKKTESLADKFGNMAGESVQNVWLAGLGAFALAREESGKVIDKGSKLFGDLVGEGREYEKKLRALSESGAAEVSGRLSEVAKRIPRSKVIDRVLPRKIETNTYHLVPKEEQWAVRREGSETNITLHATKKAALDAARGIAQAHEPSRLVVHRLDGTIQESYSYGEAA